LNERTVAQIRPLADIVHLNSHLLTYLLTYLCCCLQWPTDDGWNTAKFIFSASTSWQRNSRYSVCLNIIHVSFP